MIVCAREKIRDFPLAHHDQQFSGEWQLSGLGLTITSRARLAQKQSGKSLLEERCRRLPSSDHYRRRFGALWGRERPWEHQPYGVIAAWFRPKNAISVQLCRFWERGDH